MIHLGDTIIGDIVETFGENLVGEIIEEGIEIAGFIVLILVGMAMVLGM